MSNSVFQLGLAVMLVIVGTIILFITETLPSIWFVGAAIVLAIMGLTMELEEKE